MANIPDGRTPFDFPASYETFDAEKVSLYVQAAVSQDYAGLGSTLKFRSLLQAHVDNMVMQITGWCAAGRIPSNTVTETVEYPDGPWQALWEVYAPEWCKSRWPTKMKSHHIDKVTNHYFVCPHLPFPDSDRDTHIRFMMTARGSANRPW
jgi:hypothetical protein